MTPTTTELAAVGAVLGAVGCQLAAAGGAAP